MKQLGERAVRAKAFAPMNGMLMRSSVVASRTWRMDYGDHGDTWDDHDRENWYLDLSDAASVGCLLALVREAWSDPSLCANDAGHYDLMFWHVYTDDRNVSEGCQTEAEALVAALEAAP